MSSALPVAIERVKIQNFRSIREVDLALPEFAVLVGPNGSGKTNFVQALALLGEMLLRGTTEPIDSFGWDELVRRGRKRAHHLLLGATVRVDLPRRGEPDADAPMRIEIEIDLKKHPKLDTVVVAREHLKVIKGDAWLQLEVVGSELSVSQEGTADLVHELVPVRMARARPAGTEQGADPGKPKDPLSELQAYFEPRVFDDDAGARFLRLLSLPRFYSPLLEAVTSACAVQRLRLDATALRAMSSAHAALGGAGEGLAAVVAEIRGMDAKPKKEFLPILSALQEVFPRVEDVLPTRVGAGQLILAFRERGVATPFAQSSVSDGVLHALALLLGLAPSRRGRLGPRMGGLLAIEEPENAIHPWSIRVLLKRMQAAQRRQILLTTHSVEVVNQVRKPASLLLCEATDDGTQIVAALDRESALVAIVRGTGEGLGDLWKSGTLGGVPGPEDDG